jgi:hypothetical protein
LRIVAAMSSLDYDRPMQIYPYLLSTFAYREMSAERLPARVNGAKVVWIDSGAFTVWTKGERIDLGEYIAHLRTLKQRVGCPIIPINLDVIPGEPRRAPTRAEAREAMAAGERNARHIRAAGLPVMEVWHRGEPLEQLLTIAERRQPGELIGIGGLVGLRPNVIRQVCDPAFASLRDAYGWNQLPPVHGLGVGNRDILFRYPWWSADSTSWIAPGVWGRVVNRAGTTVKDPRARNRSMRLAECARILRLWLRWNDELTRMWEARGVRFATPPEEVTV